MVTRGEGEIGRCRGIGKERRGLGRMTEEEEKSWYWRRRELRRRGERGSRKMKEEEKGKK